MMRISSSLFFQTGLNSINAQQADLMHLYQQIGSGQRMVTPADDPLAAAQAINISQAQSLNKRYSANRDVANGNLGTEDNTLNSIVSLMQNVKTSLVQAGNGTLSDDDRTTLANVLQAAKSSMLALANSTDGNGQYLFSGSQGGNAAYVTDASGKVTWNGDSLQRNIQVDQTRQIAGSDVGSDIFQRATPGTTSYLTSAGTNNTGTVLINTPVVSDPAAANVAEGFQITFDPLTPNKYSVVVNTYKPDGTLLTSSAAIAGTYDTGTSSLTLPNGAKIGFSGTPGLNDSFSVNPAAPGAATYSVTAGGANSGSAGATTLSDATVTSVPVSFDINFIDSNNYQVVANTSDGAVTTSSPVPIAGTYPTGASSLTLPNGVQVKFAGQPAAGDTFSVKPTASPATDLNIFDTFDGLIAALKAPANGDAVAQANLGNALASAMQRLDVNFNNMLTVQASVGARMNEIDAITANGATRDLGYTNQLSKLEDLDYYTATTQLNLRQSALQAAALAFQKIQGTSLFNPGN